GRGTVRQPEEHCATSAGELASASLAGGQLRCGPSGGAPHRSGGHLVGGRAFLSLRVSLSIGKPVTPCGDRPACALDSVAGARNNGQPITANGDSSFLLQPEETGKETTHLLRWSRVLSGRFATHPCDDDGEDLRCPISNRRNRGKVRRPRSPARRKGARFRTCRGRRRTIVPLRMFPARIWRSPVTKSRGSWGEAAWGWSTRLARSRPTGSSP